MLECNGSVLIFDKLTNSAGAFCSTHLQHASTQCTYGVVHHSRQGGVDPNLHAAILHLVEVLPANASRCILTDIYNLLDI